MYLSSGWGDLLQIQSWASFDDEQLGQLVMLTLVVSVLSVSGA